MVFDRAAPCPPHCSTSMHVWWLKVGCAGCVMLRDGTYLLYRPDQRLFRQYTKNVCEDTLYECEFADDVALLAITCAAAETAIQAYYSEA